jgi:hypothetical protein
VRAAGHRDLRAPRSAHRRSREDRRVVETRWSGWTTPSTRTIPAPGRWPRCTSPCTRRSWVSQRRAQPRDDIVTELLRAEVDGERLTDAEFNAFVLVLAVAGNETRGISSPRDSGSLPASRGARERAGRPLDPADRHRRDASLPSARAALPADRDARRRASRHAQSARATRCRSGTARPTATRRSFRIPTASTSGRTPNDHLSFGFGPHFCLGAALAHSKARVMFEELFQAAARTSRSPGRSSGCAANHIHGIKHLPVKFTPERGGRPHDSRTAGASPTATCTSSSHPTSGSATCAGVEARGADRPDGAPSRHAREGEVARRAAPRHAPPFAARRRVEGVAGEPVLEGRGAGLEPGFAEGRDGRRKASTSPSCTRRAVSSSSGSTRSR